MVTLPISEKAKDLYDLKRNQGVHTANKWKSWYLTRECYIYVDMFLFNRSLFI